MKDHEHLKFNVYIRSQCRFSDSPLDLALPCFSFEVDGFTMMHLKDMNYFILFLNRKSKFERVI